MSNNSPIEHRIDEVAIGLASEAEYLEVERLAAENPEIAAMLERARVRFNELDATADPSTLPDDMWDRVSQGIDATATPAEPDQAPQSNVVAFPKASAPPKLLWTAITSLAACLVLSVALGWTLISRTDPLVIAVLVNDQGQPVALVEGTVDNTTLVTLLGQTSVQEGQVMQVWTKPTADGPPVSLGIMDRPQMTRFEVEGLPSPSADQLYEITFEQAGGSPTGLPTGPIHGKGLAQIPL